MNFPIFCLSRAKHSDQQICGAMMANRIIIKLRSFLVAALLISGPFGPSVALADIPEDKVVGTKFSAIYHAKGQIGRPYLFGGTDPKRGFDCSGLIQFAYQTAGVQLPRDTRSQYQYSKRTDNPEPGDLVFFVINGKSISHAGIYIGNNKMIHAPSSGKRVEITRFDTPYWKKHFYGYGKL